MTINTAMFNAQSRLRGAQFNVALLVYNQTVCSSSGKLETEE